MNKVIALGADNGIAWTKVETTIKSVCVHNDNIKFYVLMMTFPSEWFRVMEQTFGENQLKNCQCEDFR